MIRDDIQKFFAEGVVEKTKDFAFGDYASNAAFVVSQKTKESPVNTAEEIVAKISKLKAAKEMFAKIDVVNGFINLTLSPLFLHKELAELVSRREVKVFSEGKKKKINVEFLSANPTGAPHVGNGRGAFFGDVLGNVFSKMGHEVTKEYYINNARVGAQIKELGKTALGKGDKYKTSYLKKKISDLKEALVGVDESEAGFLLAESVMKDTKKFLEDKAGIIFDEWTEEEELYKKNRPQNMFDDLKDRGLVNEKDGAEWLKATQFGDEDDKVLKRSDGTFGYYLADIAYHKDKIDRKFDIIIDILGADHQGHVKFLEMAVEKILEYTGVFCVLITQMVRTKGGGRLSKREGELVDLEELVDDVGIDAVRYFYLSRALSSQMEFDIDLAKEQSQKNPVYYVQYTHARTSGILRNSDTRTITASKKQLEKLTSPEELHVISKLLQYPEVLSDIAKNYNVHQLTAYVFDLATVFNRFYEKNQVLVEEKDVRAARLALVFSTQMVFRDCLEVLGISAPNKM